MTDDGGGPDDSESPRIEHGVVKRDARAIKEFLEEALGVEVRIEDGPDGIVIQIAGEGVAGATVVTDLGTTISDEIAEAVENIDIAASVELEDIEGIGQTYADRLRKAGIRTVATLAAATPKTVVAVADATHDQARRWIASAREMIDRVGG